MSPARPRDPEQTAGVLRAWLGTKLLGVTDLVVSGVVVGGVDPLSLPTATEVVAFRADWMRTGVPGGADYVAKLPPPGPSGFPRLDLVTEQSVMQALSVHSAAPVPSAPWVETDPGVLGRPFLVLERLPGLPVGRLPELSDEQRATLWDNALVALTRIHAVDHAALGLDFLDRPAPGPAVLTWGSARLGNLLFDDDLNVTAVLSWERARLGPREVDLAELLLSGQAFADVDGAATMARYSELTGHQIHLSLPTRTPQSLIGAAQ